MEDLHCGNMKKDQDQQHKNLYTNRPLYFEACVTAENINVLNMMRYLLSLRFYVVYEWHPFPLPNPPTHVPTLKKPSLQTPHM